MDSDEAEELVPAARAGDGVAVERLVRRFQDLAVACAFGWLGDLDQAPDSAQEAFVVALGRLDQLQDPRAFPGWFR
jgi:DNA-directed RNA polymerase specialized sigma24 family protein